ncbi:MAG: hypothetical protein ABWY13_11635 [Mesorhizobium sp.]
MLLRREWQPWELRQCADARKTSLVNAALNILKDWRSSPFEFEGAVRHGIRSALGLERWSWRDADRVAAQTIEAAFFQLKVERPTWHQGQPGWTEEGFSPVGYTRCIQCGKPLPESRGDYGRKYCSSFCHDAHYKHGAGKWGETTDRAIYLAFMAAKTEKTRRERTEAYGLEGERWRNGYHKKLRSERRAAVRAELRCQVCNERLAHLSRADARYCSKHCQMIAYNARKSQAADSAKPLLRNADPLGQLGKTLVSVEGGLAHLAVDGAPDRGLGQPVCRQIWVRLRPAL